MELKANKAFLIPPRSEPSEEILSAARIISKGGCVAVPTETVYGLAANALNEEACKGIFSIKNRPYIDPLIVHVSSFDMLNDIAYTNELALKLAKKYWAGPLTMVLKKKDVISDIVSANLDTVAVRMSKHPIMNALIEASNVPLAAPSANPFGYISPTKAEHVKAQLGDKIELILDGGQCQCGLESTIISLVDETCPKLLRYGPISKEDIEETLAMELEIPKANPAQPTAPGMLKAHYSPNAQFSTFTEISEIEEGFEGAIIYLKRPELITKDSYWLSEDGNLEEIAKNLYDLIRFCDKTYKNIKCQCPKNEGLGAAICDRLRRASEK
ncbi:MAG: L-threonylcarbamoyladenylate synthase [Opitutales bacterium]